MIRFLQHESIDKAQWDICIGQAANGKLYAWSWYLDIVCPGWCALIEDDYEKVFPLPVFSKAGIKYIMQPYFTQQLGLFYRSLSSDEKLKEFINSIPPDYKYIDINLNTSNSLAAVGTYRAMTNLELDLGNDYQILASGYQSNLQRNLKKASQNKLTFTKHVRPEEIIALFREGKGQELKHLSDKQYRLIERIAYESMQKGMGEIWGVYDQYNQLAASILWVFSHQKAVFLFSAVSENGKMLHAMPWLIDTFIRQNAGKPLTLDFEGSNQPGLARFYSSFGSREITYPNYVRITLPALLSMGLKIWRIVRLKLK